MGNRRVKGEITISVVSERDTSLPIQSQFKFNGHVGYLEAVIEAIKIHTQKNSDYSGGGGQDDDPLANFKGSVEFGIDPGLGIILRIQDKFQRVKAFAKSGRLAVVNESVEDAMLDIANYALLYLALRSEIEEEYPFVGYVCNLCGYKEAVITRPIITNLRDNACGHCDHGVMVWSEEGE